MPGIRVSAPLGHVTRWVDLYRHCENEFGLKLGNGTVQKWFDEYPLMNNAEASSDDNVRSEVILFVSNAANEADRSRRLREQPSTTRAKRTVAPPSGAVSGRTRSRGAAGSDEERFSQASYRPSESSDSSVCINGSSGAVGSDDEGTSAASSEKLSSRSGSSEHRSIVVSPSQRGSQDSVTDEGPGTSSQDSSVLSLVF
jgi:hypothetical protein